MLKPKIPLEELDDYIRRINQASSVDEIIEILQSQIKRLGFDKMTYWLRWHHHETNKPIFFSTYSKKYQDHYVEQDFKQHDMVGKFSNIKNTPFKWSEIAQKIPITPMQKILFSDSAAVGIRSGGSIPIHGPNLVKATLSVANDAPTKEFDEHFDYHRHEIALMANYAHEKMLSFGLDSPIKPNLLTPREVQILTFVSRGKTYWEISVILSIQEDTVKKHMQNIGLKLNVSNGSHAVAKGLAFGLINP